MYGTVDLGVGVAFGSWAEEQLSMLASRQRPVLDAVVVGLSLAVLPLKCDTLICYFHSPQVFWSIQFYNTEAPFR